MKTYHLLFTVLAVIASLSNAFSPAIVGTPTSSSMTGGSSFVISQQGSTAKFERRTLSSSSSKSVLYMGSQAKFGVFSPAVYAAKITLGTDKLNKIRGKAISLHSQYIGDFCVWVGAYHLRTRLIKKAKTNGDILGFLV
jgi:hypothetical protein